MNNRITFAHDKFDALDVDHDGAVTRQEAMPSNTLKASFAKFDTNHDGKLSLQEFAAINDLAAIKHDKAAVRKLQ